MKLNFGGWAEFRAGIARVSAHEIRCMRRRWKDRNRPAGRGRKPRENHHSDRLLEAGAYLVLGSALIAVLARGAPGSTQPTDVTGILGLFGLFLGCTLLIQASRPYLLGVGGAITCGFVAILLSTYSGLVINASSSVTDPVSPTWHVDHPAVFIAMLGYLAALLLLVSPWSHQRAWMQPMLVGAGIVLPAVALLTFSRSPFVPPTNVTARFVGRDDPLLLLGVIGIALVVPVQIAGSVGWVYFWISGASRLHGRLKRPTLEVVALTAWALWLLTGVAGCLPDVLGGRFHTWLVMRHAGARAWLLAGLVTLAAGTLAERVHASLENREGAAASCIILTYVFGVLALTVAIVVMLLCALMTFTAEPVRAAFAVGLLITSLSVGAPVVWFARTKNARPLAIGVGCVAACLAVLGAALVWPTAVNGATLPGIFAGRGINFLYLAVNSNLLVVIVLLVFPLTFAGVVAGYAVVARKVFDFHGRWSGTAEYGLALLLLPLALWMLLGAVLLLPSALAHPKGDAFAAWPLPDPSVVAVVASSLTAVIALMRWGKTRTAIVSERQLIGVIAVSALAFVPLVVPVAFRSGGRLALAGLAMQLLLAIGIVVARQLPPDRRRRNVRWQLGAATLSIPLLAHAGASAGYTPAYASGLFADVGHNVGPGLFSHLRALLVIPLVISLMLADRETPRLRWRARYRSRWRDFEADVLVEAVRDHDLADVMSESLNKHLTALDPDERRQFASWIARALARRYRVHRSVAAGGPSARQASREELNAAVGVAERAVQGKAKPAEIASALGTAEVIIDSATATAGSRDVRELLGAAIQVALEAREDAVVVLIDATLREVDATVRSFLEVENRSEAESDRGRAQCRHQLGEVMEALPRTFSLFKDPYVVALTPTLVLDGPERRQWIVDQPFEHPYRYVAVIIALVGAIAIGLYYYVGIALRLGPHILHIR